MFFLNAPPKSNAYRLVFITLGTLLFLSILGEANAACSFDPGFKAETVNITPSASISVPRDTRNGTVIYTSAFATSTPSTYRCTGGERYGIKNLIGNQSTDLTRSGISPIGTTGLGFRWIAQTRLRPIYIGPYGFSYRGAQDYTARTPYGFELVKIGPIMEGIEVSAGNIATLAAGSLNPVVTMNLTQKITVTQPTCTTPDVTAPMGTQKTSGFRGVGTSLPPVPFVIKLNNCPAGINTVKYRLVPNFSDPNNPPSVAALSAASTAKGVGVQILNNLNTPLTLGIDHVFKDYSAAGGNFSIPLKAAYYQTGSTVKGGSANTSLDFTMTYE
ncbi:type 1 fimbrial protein [Pseudomonas sp. SWRI79]|uniref:Type 1 fimbrial protein n=1 Tax=Pseudomonas farris TaxID=2841207 RepID=A0ABS6Q0M4_9PSED|nr:fimbrial protein [Pseudomonas farris]MBV4465842.1 type 1 fimbrial protein [Pseudomonas farris]